MTASGAPPGDSPFALLGLPASPAVTDDDARAAWRRVAAATHPDRPDGGDPARFAAASAAYTALRTRSGRGEALADLAGHVASRGRVPMPREALAARPPARESALAPAVTTLPRRPGGGPQAPGGPYPGQPGTRPAGGGRPAGRGWLGGAAYRVTGGRPAVLALRLGIVAAVGAGSAALVGPAPATPALITGGLTWLILTGRGDLAPPG